MERTSTVRKVQDSTFAICAPLSPLKRVSWWITRGDTQVFGHSSAFTAARASQPIMFFRGISWCTRESARSSAPSVKNHSHRKMCWKFTWTCTLQELLSRATYVVQHFARSYVFPGTRTKHISHEIRSSHTFSSSVAMKKAAGTLILRVFWWTGEQFTFFSQSLW